MNGKRSRRIGSKTLKRILAVVNVYGILIFSLLRFLPWIFCSDDGAIIWNNSFLHESCYKYFHFLKEPLEIVINTPGKLNAKEFEITGSAVKQKKSKTTGLLVRNFLEKIWLPTSHKIGAMVPSNGAVKSRRTSQEMIAFLLELWELSQPPFENFWLIWFNLCSVQISWLWIAFGIE